MKKKKIILAVLAIVSVWCESVCAQESVKVLVNKDGKTVEEQIELPSSMTSPLDSLLVDWKVKRYISVSEECSTSTENPYFSDSVYIDRLHRLPTVMEMAYNNVVREFIDLYCGRLRNRVSYMLSMANFYMPMFEEALDAYNLPLELKYLPIIESALNPSAVSRVGATGLWQFMLKTGKSYGLEVNSYVDDRRDPIKSTWAAARYLRDMYDIYKDWNLVIAAYNCGPGNINKAIRRAGGKTDYWEIFDYLPRETRGYVPSFIAANYVMTYYCKHNICAMSTSALDVTDTISINKNIYFEQIAAVCGIDVQQLKSLNPQYRRNVIPGETSIQTLRLPVELIGKYISLQDSVYAYKQDTYFKNRKVVVAGASKGTTSGTAVGSVRYHKIRSGENLGAIARRYGVSVSQLKKWNGLKSDRISAGKTLKIMK
ncbi:MAG: transglycosylase SLT domain-containing protein [Bacteroidales bacterium]|nr:transglycosylase SLT domain-containing protein [Bacteroidales bacterium]